jgi:uncharacterized protein involved in cysteine biosynthesis
MRRILVAIVDSGQRLLVVGMLSVLIAIGSFVPLLSLPLLVVSAFLAGSDIFSTPLSLLGIPFSKRWRMSIANAGWCVLTGALLLCSLIIPLGSFIMYPLLISACVQRLRDLRQERRSAEQ